MKGLLTIIIFLCSAVINAQADMTISGKTFNNTEDTWAGVNIERKVPTRLIFKNNTISSKNRYGYLLQAGDEIPAATNNNLDGAVITGNKLSWSGTDMEVIPHGVFTGHNRDVIVKYNYLNYVPMGIIVKSGNNMSNTGGGIAYNIVKGGAVAMNVKGISNVNIFNNTFYTDRTPSQTWRPLVYVYTNTDDGRNSVAHGTKIYNNIFYTKYQTPAINILDQESLTGLECDYNVYWCETGSPRFVVNEAVISFEEWQGMGFDRHSVVMNPRFRDLVSFVPTVRLDYGTDLGDEWKLGLSANAVWGVNDPSTTAQNGKWQAGAVVLEGPGQANSGNATPELKSSEINNGSMDVIEIVYSSALANIVPPQSSFIVTVNSQPGSVKEVDLTGSKVLLTLENPVNDNDVVTVTYIRPDANALQSTAGVQAETINAQKVNIDEDDPSNSAINIFPNPARDFLNIINIEASASVRTLKIFDISGKLRLKKELANVFPQKIDINLSPGLYILRIENGSDIEHVQKLVVTD